MTEQQLTIKATPAAIEAFLSSIAATINKEITNSPENNDSLWLKSWRTMQSDGIMRSKSRPALAKAIFKGDKHASRKKMKECVDALCAMIPLLKTKYELSTAEYSDDVYIMTKVMEIQSTMEITDEIQGQDKENEKNVESGNKLEGEKDYDEANDSNDDDDGDKVPKYDKVITEDDFTNEEDKEQLNKALRGATEWKTVATRSRVNDADKSIHKSIQSDSILSSPSSISHTQNPFQPFMEDSHSDENTTDDGISFDTLENRSSSDKSSIQAANIQKVKENILNANQLTAKEKEAISVAMQQDTVHLLNYDLITRWVNHNMATMNNAANDNVKTINKHGRTIKDKMDSTVKDTRKSIIDLKVHCDQKITAAKREIQRAINTIHDSEEKSIAAIHTIANTETTRLSDLTTDSKNVTQQHS